MKWWPFGKNEERTTLATPTPWLFDSLGARKSASGIAVSETTALQYSAVYAAVRLLSESVASLPLVTYERLERGKQRSVSHPAHQLLDVAPNREMTAYTFRETLMGHICTWGNAYAEIVRDGAGRPLELLPITPDRVRVERDESGTVRYLVDEQVTLDSDSVLHIAGLGFDGIIGYSPIRLARECIGLGMAAERFGASFFDNAARPAGVLQHPGRLSQEAATRLRESWRGTYEGSLSTGKTAILEEGMSWQSLGIPPDDAQYLETRKFQIAEIARWYGVPPSMIGDLERATFSNIEHQAISYVTHSLRPWLVRWETELRRKLFAADEVFFPEFLVEGLLRGDTKTRYDGYKIARESGWLSVNEIRTLENLNPVDGGDSYIQPLNMGTMGAGDDARSWAVPLLADALGRAARVQDNAERNALRRKGDHYHEWRDGYRTNELPGLVADILQPAVAAIMVAGGIEGDSEERAATVASYWIAHGDRANIEAAAAVEVGKLV